MRAFDPDQHISRPPAGSLVTIAALLVCAAVLAGCGSTGQPAASPFTVASAASTTLSLASRAVSRATRVESPPPATGSVPSTAPTRTLASSISAPRVVQDPIPFGSQRKSETVAYARRHYSSFMTPTWHLIDPRVIVIHYTDSSFQSAYNTFASDTRDSELRELPGTCAHFIIDSDGTIYQLVSLQIMCRHTVGLNWTAIGIEHVGYSDSQVLGDRAQITASLRLVRWLRCRSHISIPNVIGHNESLQSPYHHEDVPSLRAQTHGDFNHADMQIYRRRLQALGGCPAA